MISNGSVNFNTLLGLQVLIIKPLNHVSANEPDNLITTHRKPKWVLKLWIS